MIFSYGKSFFNLSDVVGVKDETDYIVEGYKNGCVVKSKIPENLVFTSILVYTIFDTFNLTGNTADRFLKEYESFRVTNER